PLRAYVMLFSAIRRCSRRLSVSFCLLAICLFQTSTQRAACSAEATRNSGTATLHSLRRNPHLGSNAQPGGSAVSCGTLPGLGVSFPRSSRGDAASRPCVYGCLAEARTSFACSSATIPPAYILDT